MEKKMHFRVDTPALLNEIIDCLVPRSSGVIKVPINTFCNLLAQVAQRCTEINDPVLDKLMFDLNLYELPTPTTKEYGDIMDRVYKRCDDYLRSTKS
jgi:hypothetical protein